MTLDPSISLGSLLNAGALLVGFIVAFTRIGGRIDLLAQRILSVEETIKANRDVSERMAIMETRQGTHGQMIAGAQNDLRELKHGRGFVRGSGGIDGEYPKE